MSEPLDPPVGLRQPRRRVQPGERSISPDEVRLRPGPPSDEISPAGPLGPQAEPDDAVLGSTPAGQSPAARAQPMDLSKDPDRFQPDVAPGVAVPAARAGPMDPAGDPDRYEPLADGLPVPGRRPDAGAGKDLEQLLGRDGTHEGDRDGLEWLVGLLAVVAFLALVALLFNTVLTPG